MDKRVRPITGSQRVPGGMGSGGSGCCLRQLAKGKRRLAGRLARRWLFDAPAVFA